MKASRARAISVLLLAAVALAASGCGSSDHPNNPRPPAPITVGAIINNGEVNISPTKFGAGAVRIVAANQLTEPIKLNISGNQFDQTISIGPNDTSNTRVQLNPGAYLVTSDPPGGDGVELTVGPQRESAQQELLQP